jgi:lipopolysaccharide transport system ATP-binding protein
MNDAVIRIENLGKRYRLGKAERYKTLRESLSGVIRAPMRQLRRLQQPGRNDDPMTDLWALRDVSFDVGLGEVVGIIGRNGAGKSTLLKVLSRITEPTTGTIDISGRVGSLLEVGTGFHPELTGRENIFLNGAILGMPSREIRRKFDEIVAFAEVEKFLDTPVKRYSSGMYTRLAFAVAAHLEPEILVVDEVLAVGDAAFQKRCLGKIGDVARHGRTVLFVSHNMAAVTQLCTRAIWLDQGRVKEIGPTDRVARNYLAAGSVNYSERRWTLLKDAPGDDRVRLLAARVVQDGVPAPTVDLNRPMEIQIEFKALRPIENLVTGVNFYDGMKTCLFAHCDWRPNSIAPGSYQKSVVVPGRTFADGQIDVLIQLVFYDPMVLSMILPSALSFDAVESNDPGSIRGPYKGAWPGVVRLALTWTNATPLVEAPVLATH